MVSVDLSALWALVGTHHKMGLGSGHGIWAGVESLGTTEDSGVGEALKVPGACTPGETETKGSSLQLCRRLPCPHVCTHTNTYTPRNTRK